MSKQQRILAYKQFIFFMVFILSCCTTMAQSNLSHTWSKGMTNTAVLGGNIETFSIATDAAGNSYVTGYFQYGADFDPGPGTANLICQASSGAYFAKYDVNGNYVFAKCISGSLSATGNGITLDAGGNIYLTGRFGGTADFDAGTGVYNLTSTGGDDIFFAKYDGNGNFIFAKAVGGSTSDGGKSIVVDGGNNIYLGGAFSGTADFDPGAATANQVSTGGTDIFIAKYTATGNYVYSGAMGASGYDYLAAIGIDAGNNLVASGYFAGTVDFDPGAGTANLTSAGLDDIFIARYDAGGNYVFAKQIGAASYEQVSGMRTDAAGNMYITGWFRSAVVDFDPGIGIANLTLVGADDIFFAKYDAAGNYVYAKSLGNTNTDQAGNINIDAAGNVYITGVFSGTLDFDPGPGVADRTGGSFSIFVAKYDAAANLQFAFGTGNSMRANDLAVDGSGNVNAVGMLQGNVDFDPGAGFAYRSAAGGLQNTYIAGYNSSGNYRFAGALGGYTNTFLSEEGRVITRDAAGNVYVAGTFQGEVDFDPGAGTALLSASSTITTIYFAKYDANGNYIFVKSLPGSANASARAIMLDAFGNIYLTGNFNGAIDADPGVPYMGLNSAGSQDFFFAKYDASGNYIFAKQVGSTSVDQVNAATLDASGNILICGAFYGTVDFDPGAGTANQVTSGFNDGYFAKYDANGNYIYAKKLSATSYISPEKICVNAAGNIFLTGRLSASGDFDPAGPVVTLTSAGSEDIFIARYDASGNYVYAKRLGGTGIDQAYGNAVDASDNMYIVGGFNGTADFDPGAGTVNLVSGGGADPFIAKYDGSGNYVYAKSFVGGSGGDFALDLDIDASANIYVTGYYNATVDFDGGAGVANLVSAGSRDGFIAKYDVNGNYVYAKSIGGIGGDSPTDINRDAAGNILITGSFQYTADLDPNANTSLLTSINTTDIFISKYTECATPVIVPATTVSTLTTISGTTALTDGGCALLTAITPNGALPVSGTVTAKVWIEAAVPVFNVLPFVARHYEITPTTNAATATGKVMLYFTQQEFDDFNAHPNSLWNLPANATDNVGKANLRIGNYTGSSNDGSGLPGSYTPGALVIDPVDTDIAWNPTLSRWEVSFDAVGFGGYVLQTTVYALATDIDLSGRLLNNDALLHWQTANERNTRSFVLERSTDGRNYTAVYSVAAFNTAGNHQYHFTDAGINALNAAVVYYRIQQTDIAGRFTYSNIIALSPSGKTVVLLYPNPVMDKANLMITVNKAQQVKYSVIDHTGRTIMHQTRQLITGSNVSAIDVHSLPQGMYQVLVTGETVQERISFVKK